MSNITKKEAIEIMNQIEKQGLFSLSSIERAVEKRIKNYRDSLNNEIITQIKKKHEPQCAVPCDCGGKLEDKGLSKKN